MIPDDILAKLSTSWAGLRPSIAVLVLLVVVRRLLPAGAPVRGRVPVVFAVIAIALRLGASSMLMGGMWLGWAVLNVLVKLFLALALIGLVALVVYDLILLRVRVNVPAVLRDLSQIVVAVGIIAVFLQQRGLDPFTAVTTSAVLTAVVGLALQSTIANVFAGLYLPLDRTLGIGDWIKVGEHTGQIGEINWRATRIVTKDGDAVFVPNGQLISSEVLNYSRPTGLHRMSIRIGFHYRHPPNLVREVLTAAATGAPGVVAHPPPDCLVADFADSSITYLVRYWIDDFEDDVVIDSDVRARIWYAAERAGLEIPFPIRTLTLPTDVGPVDSTAAARTVLDRTDLFATLEPPERDVLARGMRRARFARGEEIVRQGDRGDAVYVVEDGRVGVGIVVDDIGREIAGLGPGDLFGEMGLLTDEPRRASCFARTEVTCWVIDHPALRALLSSKPAVAERLADVIAAREAMLAAEQEGLSASARDRHATELRTSLVDAARRLFGIGSTA